VLGLGPVALLAVCLGACAPTLSPLRPQAQLPERFVMYEAAGDQPFEAAKVHWRAFFRDPRLQGLIAAALSHNRDLRQAAARVTEARAQWAQAKAERWPLLTLGSQARLDRAYAPNLSLGPERRLDLGVFSTAFELDFFGRLASLAEAAKAQFLATEEARRATELALVAQVASLYYAQKHVDQLQDNARAAVVTRVRALQVLRDAQATGLVSAFELAQAEAQLAQARSLRTQWGHQGDLIRHLLQQLVGPLPTGLPDGWPLQALLDDNPVQPGLPSQVLLLRPDVQAAEHRLRAAQANVAAARAAFFPRISLTASAGVAGDGLSSLFSAGAWSFQPSLSLPLFDGGRTQAGFDLARAREVGAVAQYEATLQQAFREVADQLSARASLAMQADAARQALAAQQQRLALQLQRQAAGMASLLDVLEAEREVLTAEQVSAQLDRARLDAMAGLYKALGGGAQAQAQPSATAGAAAAPTAAAQPIQPAAQGGPDLPPIAPQQLLKRTARVGAQANGP
jgi:multidrug efflux system outer membrane protein